MLVGLSACMIVTSAATKDDMTTRSSDAERPSAAHGTNKRDQRATLMIASFKLLHTDLDPVIGNGSCAP
jgi:hypothetical protein